MLRARVPKSTLARFVFCVIDEILKFSEDSFTDYGVSSTYFQIRSYILMLSKSTVKSTPIRA